MAGSSIYEYVHPGDHEELTKQLHLSSNDENDVVASPETGESKKKPKIFEKNKNTSSLECQKSQVILSNQQGFHRNFCVRMKSTLTKRGCNLRTSGYRVSTPFVFSFESVKIW